MNNGNFQRNLFLSVGGIFLLYALCFSIYQYRREKEYKIDIMQSRLQMYNYEMMQTLGDSLTSYNAFSRYVSTHNVEGLRVTIISSDGTVLMDSKEKDVSRMGNHALRHEIQQALQTGSGYDIKRTSASTHQTYFYSATLFNSPFPSREGRAGAIIRSAVPYSAQLSQSLEADNSYLWYALILTILLGIVLYRSTSRIGRHIGYLRQFAQEAEQGQELDHELERRLPDDELGDISHIIIALYWKLRHAEEDKLRIKRQLTQNAAHELKTPTASIHGYLESILQNPDMDDDTRQHFLERCYAQSERMSKLLLDMAALSKLDDQVGMQSQNAESITMSGPFADSSKQVSLVDVVPIISNVLDDTALQLEAKGIITGLNLPERILIHGDQSLLYSIFRNLVDNALAYATGATRISITTAECQDGDTPYYEFIFSDNGSGVEPQHLEHLFERFYRVDKGRSRKLGGTGLGLAIVKNAVAAHGGTTTASITPGGGLTITFTLMR